jgi:hypothetical protein
MNPIALIEKTRSLIAAGDISGAEAALADLADTEGDGALMVVLEQLQPKDILAVIREYDNSKDSVINLLVTPAQFARAVVIEKQYKDLTRTHLRGMMNAVIFREDADPIEFLTAIGDLEGGSEALADYFSEKWSRIEAFARTGLFDTVEDDGEIVSEATLRGATYARARIERDEVADQDWMELAWILRYELPDLFIEMLLVLRAKARAHDLGLDRTRTRKRTTARSTWPTPTADAPPRWRRTRTKNPPSERPVTTMPHRSAVAPSAVALHDARPFFEKALHHGVQHGLINSAKLDAIRADAPKGMVQIARYFGSEYLRPELEKARARLVNLVSLSLEHSSGGDLRRAAEALRDHSLLSRSKAARTC